MFQVWLSKMSRSHRIWVLSLGGVSVALHTLLNRYAWIYFSGNFEPNQVLQVWLSKVSRPQRIRNQSIGFEVQKQVSWMLGSCQSHWFSILRFWFCLWHMPICYFFWHGQNDARYRLFLVRGTHSCIFNPNCDNRLFVELWVQYVPPLWRNWEELPTI